MEIQEQSHGAVTVIKPVGALTETEARIFKNRVMEIITKNLGRVLIDATAVAFLDSHGIEALADVTEELGQSGKALKLCAVNATVKHVLELTGWSDAFEYFDDVNTGVRTFL